MDQALNPSTPPSAPSVSVVIATRDRPEMLREAIASALGQDYPGPIEVIVVADQSEPDTSLSREGQDGPPRRVEVVANDGRPGLAGARNCGIRAAQGEFVAFCDDDDYWLPGKVAAQVAALRREPAAAMSTCGIGVEYDGERHERVLDRSHVTFEELLRDRHTELHPSTFLLRRSAYVDRIGLVDEAVPGGFGEDYEFLLRTARDHPIANVAEVFTVVRWGGQSYFFQRWQTMIDGLTWILERYPEFAGSPRGSARINGQLAFANAALGRRRAALVMARRSLRDFPLEPRSLLTLLVLARLVTPDRVMTQLHRRGRGI